MTDRGSMKVSIQKVSGQDASPATDHLAVEEPLEIRLAFGPRLRRTVQPLSVTMRTPGDDFELAAGFLLTEGIIHQRSDVERVYHCGPETGPLHLHNVVRVEIAPDVPVDLDRLERHFYTTSSCGVCGKTSIAAIRTLCPQAIPGDFSVRSDVIHALPEFLRHAQPVFDRTGGLHAAALFDGGGKLIRLCEDIGRHNAVDKVIGSEFLAGHLPARDTVLLVSGRASFELMQKAIMAGIPIFAAVGAPSSLAVQLAHEFNVTLLGFVREGRFNIYAGEQRITRSNQNGAMALETGRHA
jgi:FdhD protein